MVRLSYRNIVVYVACATKNLYSPASKFEPTWMWTHNNATGESTHYGCTVTFCLRMVWKSTTEKNKQHRRKQHYAQNHKASSRDRAERERVCAQQCTLGELCTIFRYWLFRVRISVVFQLCETHTRTHIIYHVLAPEIVERHCTCLNMFFSVSRARRANKIRAARIFERITEQKPTKNIFEILPIYIRYGRHVWRSNQCIKNRFLCIFVVVVVRKAIVQQFQLRDFQCKTTTNRPHFLLLLPKLPTIFAEPF